MQKVRINLEEVKLVGISVRTSNAKEMNPETAKIGATIQKFFENDMQSKIQRRKNPGTVLAVYTNYESDEHGEYTYFFGEEVNDFENISHGLETLSIPSQIYVKLTSEKGQKFAVCIGLWQKIWSMKPDDLGGKRAYIADFEVYDERSLDPNSTVLDIYIGIKK